MEVEKGHFLTVQKLKQKKDSTVEAMKKQSCSLCYLTSPKIGSVAKVRDNSL